MFKWSTDFRYSEESPIVPVWISLPFLPVHFMHCRQAIHSIAAAIGKPLRVDHATASLNRPSVARVLIEYDISQPLLPRIWIGEGESGFWQDIIFERVPQYCGACRHLGHSPDTCYITRPELRTHTQPNRTETVVVKEDKGKAPIKDVKNQPMGGAKPQYVIRADRRETGAGTTVETGRQDLDTHEAQAQEDVREPQPATVGQDTTEAETTAGDQGATPLEQLREDTSVQLTSVIPSSALVCASDMHVSFNTESPIIPIVARDGTRASHSADDVSSDSDSGALGSDRDDTRITGSEIDGAGFTVVSSKRSRRSHRRAMITTRRTLRSSRRFADASTSHS